MDTILTVVLVLACIAMIALSAILLYDLSKEFIEDQRAAKRQEEFIKKWANMDLSKYKYEGGYIQTAIKEDFIKNQEFSEYLDKIIKDSIDRVDNCPYKLNHKCQKTANQIPCHELIAIGSCDAVKGIGE